MKTMASCKPLAKYLLPVLSVVLLSLSACTSTASKPDTSYFENNVATTADNLIFIDSTEAINSPDIVLSKSPWGDNIAVAKVNQYDAASGRPCMQLQIVPQNKRVLVCEVKPSYWEAVRFLETSTSE